MEPCEPVPTNEYGWTFADWLKQVDNVVIAKTGMSESDLPDWCSWDAWNDGLEPYDAAVDLCIESIEDMGFDPSDFGF